MLQEAIDTEEGMGGCSEPVLEANFWSCQSTVHAGALARARARWLSQSGVLLVAVRRAARRNCFAGPRSSLIS
jgi:hypothetical protein